MVFLLGKALCMKIKYIKTQLNSNDVIAVNLKDGSSRVLTASVRVKPITAKVLID